MSALSAILRELRFEAAGYRRLALRAPWAIAFEQAGLRGVHIVLEGRCEAVFEELAPCALGPGDFVLAPRADPHVLRSIGGARCKVISPAQLGAPGPDGRVRAGGAGEETVILCGAFVFHAADHPALAALPRLIHVPAERGQTPKWLAAYTDLLNVELAETGPHSAHVMARLTDALLARALREYAQASEEPGWLQVLQDPALARALAAMHEQMHKAWTLAALAKLAGMSRASFAQRFADTMGETPMHYLLRCRMRRALTLLQDARLGLAQVAQRVGYGSEAALSSAFKRHFGKTPGTYRREH